MTIDHEATWKLPVATASPPPRRASAGVVIAALTLVGFLWWAGEEIRSGLADLEARPWKLPPQPPPIAPPCIIVHPVYEWPGVYQSSTVAVEPRESKEGFIDDFAWSRDLRQPGRVRTVP